jgi:nucleoid-associated protein YgaU
MSVNKSRIASELLGLLPGGGGLQKLTILYERYGWRRPGVVQALFNPREIALGRTATWERERAVTYGGAEAGAFRQAFRAVEAATLSIELFFDTYEARSALGQAAASFRPAGAAVAGDATDVRRHTGQIAGLAEVDQELHRPPVCQLRWGTFDIFTGVLTSVQQRFTLFLSDGTPVRATLTCDFVEFSGVAGGRANEPHSADVARTRQVKGGDTLLSLAAEEYGDPALWRHIARANRIVNARVLAAGTVLTIPKLRP